MTLSSGTRLGHYEIVEPIGAGGMGEVYRAKDRKLKRDVAVKVLPESLAGDAEALARFEREAVAVAALSHANILSIHDFGTEGNTAYAVMELLEGSTLRELLAAGPIPRKRVVDYALQIAKGLSAAHERGIVHRDLKPENIFVTDEGTLKILDFGLARRIEPRRADETSAPTASQNTEPGAVMGTVGYMSPEQVKGIAVDHRSDIFAFGTVLYEMLTGARAWKRDSAAETIAAILKEDPPEPVGSGGPLSPALSQAVAHCLEKRPEDRFQSARDIVFNLQEAASGAVTVIGTPSPWKMRATVAVALIAAASVAALLLWRLRTTRGSEPAPRGGLTIAVLPFRNLTGRPEGELMGIGLADTLSVRLGGLRDVQIVPARAVVEAASKEPSGEHFARRLGATRLLEGGLQRDGERFRITYRVTDASGAQVAAGAVDGSDLFGLQDRVADQVAGDLKLDRGVPPKSLASGIEAAPDQELYLQAVGLLQRYDRRSGVEKATEILRGLVERYPRSALARASYGRACLAMFDFTKERAWADRSAAEAESARRLGPDVPEVEVVVGETMLATGRAEEAAGAFRHALEVRPGYFEALLGLGRARQAARDDRAAEAALRQAIELQPTSFAAHNQLGALFAARGRYAEAADEFRRVTLLVPDSYRAFSNLGGVSALRCDFATALEAFRKALELRPGETSPASNLGLTLLWMGRFDEAIDPLERAVATSPDDCVAWGNLAEGYRAAGGKKEKEQHAFNRSVTLARQQLLVNPNDAAVLSFLAYGLAQTQRAAEAREPMRRALALDQGDPQILASAAMVAALDGRKVEALDWLRKAVAAGYCRSIIDKQPGLASLRNEPEFRSLVAGR